MSDRCVFVPYPNSFDTYDWADVVIAENAKPLAVCRAARRFLHLPGPHKVFLQDRNDPRFQVFKKYLSAQYFFDEADNYSYCYSVHSPSSFPPQS
jgi:hypothetical protein